VLRLFGARFLETWLAVRQVRCRRAACLRDGWVYLLGTSAAVWLEACGGGQLVRIRD
jgi:hypothetical protein